MQTQVELVQEGDCCTICLSAPCGKPPTLDTSVLEAMSSTLAGLEASPPKAVVLTSNSEKYFCAGANVRCLQDLSRENIRAWVEFGHRVFNQIEDLPCPVFAKVDGYAMGGGLELALAADCIVSTPTATFAQSEATLGFVPGWGGTFRLAEKIGAARAKELFFSARHVRGEEAYAIGLVDLLAEAGGLDERLDDLLRAVAKNSACACRNFKSMVNMRHSPGRGAWRESEVAASEKCLDSLDTKERVQSFLSRKRSRANSTAVAPRQIADQPLVA
jgi:enoyl-CoA hydratase